MIKETGRVSNGAKKVVLVEQNQEIYTCLKNNCSELNILEQVELYRQSAENFVRRIKDIKFDLISFISFSKKVESSADGCTEKNAYSIDLVTSWL